MQSNEPMTALEIKSATARIVADRKHVLKNNARKFNLPQLKNETITELSAERDRLKAALSKLVTTISNQDLTTNRPGVDMAAYLAPFRKLT